MAVVADGFRQRKSFVTGDIWAGYAFHAVFGVLGVWLMLRAVGA